MHASFATAATAGRRFSFWKLPAALLLALMLGRAELSAQEAATTEAKFPIATVRIDLVLRDYEPFAKQMQSFQADRKTAQEELEVQQAEAETTIAKLRSTPPGTPKHDDLQREVVKLQTQLRQQLERTTQVFQKREAKIYIEVFAKIDAQLKLLAKKHGLKMILRKQEVELKEDLHPQLFAQALNRLVLLDETEDLTAELTAALKAADAAKPADDSASK